MVIIFIKEKNKVSLLWNLCFCGKQGQGKTLSMVNFCYQLHKKYDFVPIRSNFGLPFAHYFHDFEEIRGYKNPEGSIWLADELGILCNSKTSKDFNSDILEIAAQNRKNHRLIMSTCQQYFQIHKDLRTQAYAIINVKSLFGILTINSFCDPSVDNDGNVKCGLPYKISFFLHTQKLYDLYDSWECISR